MLHRVSRSTFSRNRAGNAPGILCHIAVASGRDRFRTAARPGVGHPCAVCVPRAREHRRRRPRGSRQKVSRSEQRNVNGSASEPKTGGQARQPSGEDMPEGACQFSGPSTCNGPGLFCTAKRWGARHRRSRARPSATKPNRCPLEFNVPLLVILVV